MRVDLRALFEYVNEALLIDRSGDLPEQWMIQIDGGELEGTVDVWNIFSEISGGSFSDIFSKTALFLVVFF